MEEKHEVDIKTLIKTSNIDIYDKNELINKLKNYFSDDEQRLYVSNLFLYLNYNQLDDFIINLDNVWKFIGFSNKANAKRLLKHNFTENKDYKTLLVYNDEQTIFIRTDENKINEETRGRKQETIMLNINTFKKLCLKANTENADKIHDYYIKLEMVYNELMKEQLEQKEKQIEEQQKTIELLENRPDTEGFSVKKGYVYLIKDTSSIGSYKIGLAENPDGRLTSLNVASSNKSLKMLTNFQSSNMKYAEKLIHILLEPFRIKKRAEWFFFSNDLELNYAINVIKTGIEIVDKCSFIDYISFKNYAENLQDKLNSINEKNIIVEKPDKYINSHTKPDKISNYNGVSWCIRQNKWVSRLTKDNNTVVLGYYLSELDAAITYNDYASYLNESLEIKYRLNRLENYVPNPRDLLEEYRQKRFQSKSTDFNGVYFIKSKQIFEASIQYKRKSYKLIKNTCDIECAKVYNEQALFFNNNFGTKYKINDIENFVTLEKNHIHELEINKVKKYSRFVGVTIRKESGKFRAYIKHDRKVIYCGSFVNEIDAAKAYNKKAEELNRLTSTKVKYQLNVFDDEDLLNKL
jgi:hypothetical protein